jgi:hypothetical protein
MKQKFRRIKLEIQFFYDKPYRKKRHLIKCQEFCMISYLTSTSVCKSIISFAGVAVDLGLHDFWTGGVKTAILALLENTYSHKKEKFCALIIEIVIEHQL